MPVSNPTSSTSSPPPQDPKPVSVRFVNAAAFRTLTRRGAHPQILTIHRSDPEAFLSGAKVDANTATPDTTHEEELNKLRSQIPPDYHEFLDVFSKAKADALPGHNPLYDHHIDLEDRKQPPVGPIYNLSEVESAALRDFPQENLARNFICPSQSACGAPALFIKKKDGSLRLCVDWRGLNAMTRKDRYPLPLIPNLLDRLRESRVFTEIDLRGAYNLVRIAPGDEWKTASRTRYGSFDFLVMHFGLTNAPATFQRLMNSIFSDILDGFVVIYLDDILIFSKNPSDHAAHVREVLSRLRKHRLFAKPEKCEFSVDSTEFLGFVVSPSGVSMAQDKVDTILKWPAPRNVKQVQSFLVFANFYQRFIFNYSDIVVPLTRLTCKDVPWNWDTKSKAAFCSLKESFTQAPVLTHWSLDAQILVETDASDYALAGIISSLSPDGKIHPITFHSRTFTNPELNYDTHDEELLAIFECFKVWRHYLEGSQHRIIAHTNRTIGPNSCRSQSSRTTTLQTLRPAYLPSSPIRATIQLSTSTQSATSPRSVLASSPSTFKSFTCTSLSRSSSRKNGIRQLLISTELNRRRSILATRYCKSSLSSTAAS
jgi:hypothetical protein